MDRHVDDINLVYVVANVDDLHCLMIISSVRHRSLSRKINEACAFSRESVLTPIFDSLSTK